MMPRDRLPLPTQAERHHSNPHPRQSCFLPNLSYFDSPNRQAINPHRGLAHSDRHTLALLAAYPDAGVEGQVEVLFEVDDKGFVRDPEIGFASHRDFGESVKVAVEKWRFSPARRAGIAVSQRVRVPVVFVVKANDPLSKWAGRNVFRRTQSQPVEADELDEWPQPIAWIEPYYPPSLAGTGQRAEIVVSFVVDEHGEVINPEVLIGDDPHFIASALAAAVSLRFTPQLNAEGDPVPVLMAVSYKFDEKKQQQWERAVAPPRNGSF